MPIKKNSFTSKVSTPLSDAKKSVSDDQAAKSVTAEKESIVADKVVAEKISDKVVDKAADGTVSKTLADAKLSDGKATDAKTSVVDDQKTVSDKVTAPGAAAMSAGADIKETIDKETASKESLVSATVGEKLIDKVVDGSKFGSGVASAAAAEASVDPTTLAAPLLLFPLRLEYRVVEKGTRHDLASAARSGSGDSRPSFDTSKKASKRTEVWFRWYLDDPFTSTGIAPVTDEEAAALKAFDEKILETEAQWYEVGDETIASAWRTLTQATEPARALYLVRHHHDISEQQWHAHIGELIAPPYQLSLYGLNNDRLDKITDSKPLADDLRYTADALVAGHWLTDYQTAIDKGMGMKLTDPDHVREALDADWIIAIGIDRNTDRVDEITDWLRDKMANGRSEFLAQDTPTNNSASTASGFDGGADEALAYVAACTQADTGSTTGTDASYLAKALGVDVDAMHETRNAANKGVQDALDMARLLVPGLLSQLFEDQDFALDKDAFTDFVIEHIIARGPLPAMRLGHSPYGVLPISSPDQIEKPKGLDDAHQAIWDFVKQIGHGYAAAQADLRDSIAVIEPDGSALAESLNAILQSNAVSTRIDLGEAEADSATTYAINCAYVSSDDYQPVDYLPELGSASLVTLDNPDKNDRKHPLLYRLMRLSREEMLGRITKSTTKMSLDKSGFRKAGLSLKDQQTYSAFSNAAGRLAERSNEELETLMFETIDAYTYRADAWVTALSHARLKLQRDAGKTGLLAGYYGILGKLRSDRVTGGSDGYYQAPSVPQAISTALLKSAHLRYQDTGAFDINLSSGRLRQAMGLMAWLRRGLNLREALGQRAERWLHDNKHDALIGPLRTACPLSFGYRSRTTRPQLLDGMKVVDSTAPQSFDTDQKAIYNTLRSMLKALLDAVNDLVMAEAVHQLANGNPGAANAWVKVLSGDPIPERMDYIHRKPGGQASSHRVASVLENRATKQKWLPRNVGAPGLAGLAEDMLGESLKSKRITMRITRSDTGQSALVNFNLYYELRLQAVDLVIGGKAELMRRLTHKAMYRWSGGHVWYRDLGELPTANLRHFAESVCQWEPDYDASTAGLEDLLNQATVLRKAVAKGRYLEPDDLNAAMDRAGADSELTDAHRLLLVEDMNASLLARITRLYQLTNMRARQLTVQIGKLETALLELLRIQDDEQAENEAYETAWNTFTSRLRFMSVYLYESSRFGLPQALMYLAVEDVMGDWDATLERLTEIRDLLQARRDVANTARRATAESELTAQRALLLSRIRVIQTLTDGDGMPVWPDFAPLAGTRPVLDVDAEAATELDQWQRIRGKIKPVLGLLDSPLGLRAWRSRDEATIIADDDTASRDEQDRPKARYFGRYLDLGEAEDSPFIADVAERICGWVSDEWSEVRPSRIQDTGIAISYDQPQSEPPHVLLLGVAANDSFTRWSEIPAAQLVQEAIRLMQIRALPARQGAFELLGPRFFAVVPPVDGEAGADRVPVRSLRPGKLMSGALADIVLQSSKPRVADTVAGLTERLRNK